MKIQLALISAAVTLALSTLAGPVYNATLPGDGRSFVVVPSRTVAFAPDWGTTTVYVCGQYVKNIGNTYMLVTSNGTSGAYSTNAPTHTSGDATPDYKGLTWRYVPQSKRQGVCVTLTSGGPVYGAEGKTAVTGKGYLLGVPTNSYLIYSGQRELSFAASGAASLVIGENDD